MTPAAAPPTDTSTALAYRHLRENILDLHLRPQETLTEARLCELLGTSRTTVRSVLARLENEGLVRKTGRSYVVSPIDLSEIQQAFDFREVLEVGALRLGSAHFTAEGLARVRERVCDFTATSPMEDYMHKATRFHIDVAAFAGNPLLLRALEDVLVRLSRARWLEASGQEGRARSHADHLHLLDLLEARDEEAACQHIQAHLRRSCRHLLGALEQERRVLGMHGLAIRP